MVTTSKSMHREVQIKHDLMIHIDGLRHTKRAVCVRKQILFISLLPLVNLPLLN